MIFMETSEFQPKIAQQSKAHLTHENDCLWTIVRDRLRTAFLSRWTRFPPTVFLLWDAKRCENFCKEIIQVAGQETALCELEKERRRVNRGASLEVCDGRYEN